MNKTYKLQSKRTGEVVEIAEFTYADVGGVCIAFRWLKEPKNEIEMRWLVLQHWPAHIDLLSQLVAENNHLEAVEYHHVPTFEEWWKVWRKKVKKARAEKVWAKLNDAQKCLAFEKKEVPYLNAGRDEQYMPHPDKWLAESGWEDQIIKRRNG